MANKLVHYERLM